MWYIPFFPEGASTASGQIDLLFLAIIGLTILFTAMVAGLVIYFSIKYRHSVVADRSGGATLFGNLKLELAWIFVPLALGTLIFLWSAGVYFNMYSPPQHASEIYVTGKQWMWKIQHPSGRREINELHVPVGQPIKLVMTSQDVIHDFFVPAFRIKMDVLPGRFTELWFEADRVGEYHIFCAEYCGLDHSRMVGTVYVMEQASYEAWLQGGSTVQGGSSGDLADQGEEAFRSLGCIGCHAPDGSGAGPSLQGLYGSEEQLSDGSTVLVDDDYVLQSILDPNSQVVQGYQPIMPPYNTLSQEELLQILGYLKSIGAADGQDIDNNQGGSGESENQNNQGGSGDSENQNNQGGSGDSENQNNQGGSGDSNNQNNNQNNNQGGSNNQNQPAATPEN